jgi:hypothetical protein
VWSQDGKYIVFEHLADTKASYYLSDVNSGKTRLLLEKEYGSLQPPIWLPGHHWIAIHGEGNTIEVVKIAEEAGEDQVMTIQPSPGVPTDTFQSRLIIGSDPRQTGNPTLIGILWKDGNRLADTYIYLSAWEINVETGQWTKLVDLNKEAHYPITLGNRWAVFRTQKTIDILDMQSWKLAGRFVIPVDMYVDQIETFQDDAGNDLVSFYGSYVDDPFGIWVIIPENRKIEPQLVAVTENLIYFHIMDYSWRP